jgi:hypothetical protein
MSSVFCRDLIIPTPVTSLWLRKQLVEEQMASYKRTIYVSVDPNGGINIRSPARMELVGVDRLVDYPRRRESYSGKADKARHRRTYSSFAERDDLLDNIKLLDAKLMAAMSRALRRLHTDRDLVECCIETGDFNCILRVYTKLIVKIMQK